MQAEELLDRTFPERLSMADFNYGAGSLLDTHCEALVNAVNTEGVMGKGIALQFKKRYPEMFDSYKQLCPDGGLNVGQVQVYHIGDQTSQLSLDTDRREMPRVIINFPTKRYWRQPSNLEYVKAGLQDLRRRIVELEIASIAMPALGCGVGGLRWSDVEPEIRSVLGSVKGLRVVLFQPQ